MCAYSRSDEHIVPKDTEYGVSGLGVKIEGGCETCSGMLVFRSGGSRHPGLGLKLGFRRWDCHGLHPRGGMVKSY